MALNQWISEHWIVFEKLWKKIYSVNNVTPWKILIQYKLTIQKHEKIYKLLDGFKKKSEIDFHEPSNKQLRIFESYFLERYIYLEFFNYRGKCGWNIITNCRSSKTIKRSPNPVRYKTIKCYSDQSGTQQNMSDPLMHYWPSFEDGRGNKIN